MKKIKKSFILKWMRVSIAVIDMIVWGAAWAAIAVISLHFNCSEEFFIIMPPLAGLIVVTPLLLVMDNLDEDLKQKYRSAKKWETVHGLHSKPFIYTTDE